MPPATPVRSRDRRRRWTLAFAYSLLLASCDSPFAPDVQEVGRLEVTPPVLTMVLGGAATLVARVYDAADNILPEAKVFWSTQDPTVVAINQLGVVTAVGAGTGQLAASSGGLSRTIAVTVSQPPIALVRITPPAGNVVIGATLTLVGEALDGTGTVLPNRPLEWSSSAPAIATVNASGVVTGVSVGQSTISATGEGRTGTAIVTVFPSPVSSITITPNGGSVAAGATMLFTATPRDAAGQALTGRTLEWRSSNDAVATVSASGLLTAISPGVVTVTVSAPNGGPNGTTPTASVNVTVLIEPVASAVIVPGMASVQIGASATLTVNLFNGSGEPVSTTGRTIAWSTGNATIASVNSLGVVTGVALGTATITATVTTPGQAGTVVATAQVTVSNQPVASVTIAPTPATVHVGYSRLFIATVRNNAGQTLLGRAVVWTSTNQAIATVDQSGLVTGVSAGSVQIQATSEGVQGTSLVTIDLVAVSSVSVTPPSATIMPGQTQQLSATPQDSANTPITGPALGGRATTWTSLNTAAATVNANGLVTGVAQGAANVRATIGGTNGQSAITVNPLPSATQLAITTQPSATVQNDAAFPVQPVIQLKDASGNNVSTAGVVIQAAIVAPGTGTLGGTLSATTNASGAATFSNLKITGSTGARSLRFTSGTLTAATSSAINVQAGVPTQIVITTPPPSSANSGQVFSSATVIQLRDISGNIVPQAGVSVTAAVTPSAGVTLGGSSATTNASGAATFGALSLTGPAGNYSLTFNSGTLPSVSSGSITLGAGSANGLALTQQPSASVQNGVAFAQQPVVQLVDGSGNPVAQANVTVTAAILSGGGNLGGTTTATTNASGVATFSGLSITGVVGARTLLFGASGFNTATSNSINVTPGAAAALAITAQPSSSAQSGATFGSQPVIQLEDQSGNAVSQAGVAITASVNGAGASLIGGPTVNTNAGGTASFSGLGLSGTVGTYSLSFTSGALAGATSGSITLTAGPAAQLGLTTQPAGASSGSAFTTQPSVQVLDAQGNAVSQSGIVVTPSIASGGAATLFGGTATTNASGLATFSGLGLTGPVGNYTLGFAAPSLTGATSGTIALGPGAPSQLVILTQPAGATSGSPFTTQPSVQIRDAQGNAVTQASISVTASVNGAGATLSGSPGALTNGSGTATFTNLGLNGTPGTYTLDFASAGVPNVTSGSVNLLPGSPTQITITTQPGGAASGTAFATQPAIQLRDAGGNPVATAGVSVTASIGSGPGGASLVGSGTATSDANGLATFSGLGITGSVGSYTLTFSSGVLPNVSSASIALGPGAPAQLAIQTQPGGAVNGVAFSTQPSVQVRDAQSNAVGAGVSVSASVNGSGASLIGATSAVTNASGVATFSTLGLTGAAGSYTLDFSTAGAPNVTSGSIVLGAAAAAQLSMNTQPSASVASGNALATAPAVQLQDAGGNPVTQAGVSVTVGISPAGASLTGSTTANTDASGVATFTGLGITGSVGSYSLQFSSAGLTGTSSSSVSVTPGAAAQLSMSVQPPASSQSGAAFSTAPAVQLQDASGNPVSQAGTTVTASVGGGASLVGSNTALTNASGIATFTGLGINGGGTFTIDFSGPGLSGTTSSAVVVSAPASQLAVVTQPSATSQNGQALGTQPAVQLRDAGGNAVGQAGVTVTAEITGGTATLTGTASANTDGSGVATFTNLGITGTVGNYTLTFKSTGLTDAVSNAISLSAGAAVKLHIATEPSNSATSGVAFSVQPVVQLRDAQDNDVPSSGIAITASLNGTGGGALNGTPSIATDGAGQATFTDLSISAAGSNYSLTFSAPGLTSTTSGSISVAFLQWQGRTDVTPNEWFDPLPTAGTLGTLNNGTLSVAVNTLGVATFTQTGLRRRAEPLGRAASGGTYTFVEYP